jgi:hypothetical protein
MGIESPEDREEVEEMRARSGSDAGLADAVTRETGLHTTPWQIESWRQKGLLQPGQRTFPGRGSHVEYSPEARAQAMELARLSRKYRRHGELARALFGRGLYVEENVLKAALVRVIDRAEEWIGPSETEDDLDEVDHRAQQIAKWALRTKQGRKLQRRVRGRAAGSEEIAAGIYFTLLHLLKTGLLTSEEGFQELLDATGLRGLFTETINGVGPFAPEGTGEMEAFLQHATLGDLRERIRTSSIDDLRESRDLMAIMFRFFKNFAILATRWLDSPTALGLAMLEDLDIDELRIGTSAAVGLLILPFARTPGAQVLLEGIRRHAAYYDGLADLALRVPKEVLPAMRRGDPEALSNLADGQRLEIERAARAVAELGSGLTWPGPEPSGNVAEVLPG